MTTATIVFLLGAMTAAADAERDAAVALAKKQLGTALGVAEDAIELDKAEAVDWSDASLGCPEKGMMYAQVITPGHKVSLKAGGFGLNLTAASHVIHFDRWWNPAVENQATDRAFRIGQTKNVLVHKFLCRGTVEEKIDQLMEAKRRMSEELLEAPQEGAEVLLTEMPDDDLLKLVALDLRTASAD